VSARRARARERTTSPNAHAATTTPADTAAMMTPTAMLGDAWPSAAAPMYATFTPLASAPATATPRPPSDAHRGARAASV